MSYDLKLNKLARLGEIRIYNTATEVKISTDALAKRHEVWIRNLSSYYIYFSTTETNCVYGGSNAFVIKSGERARFGLDKDNPLTIYCISKVSIGASIDVMEVR